MLSILLADDGTIVADSKSLIKMCNTELEKINIWPKANELTINLSKSHYMVFNRSENNLRLKICCLFLYYIITLKM